MIDEEKLQENSLNVGTYLLKGFEQLRDKYPVIGDVRGKVSAFFCTKFILSIPLPPHLDCQFRVFLVGTLDY